MHARMRQAVLSRRRLDYCNLDAILSVDSRIHSNGGTQFHRWVSTYSRGAHSN